MPVVKLKKKQSQNLVMKMQTIMVTFWYKYLSKDLNKAHSHALQILQEFVPKLGK